MKKRGAIVVACLAALLVWLAWRPAGDDATGPRPAPESRESASRPDRRRTPVAAAATVSRTDPEPDIEIVPPDQVGLRVMVGDPKTREQVPGAIVYALEHDPWIDRDYMDVHKGDAFEYIKARGRAYRADDSGVASLLRFDHLLELAVQHEGRLGFARTFASRSALTIELLDVHQIRVRVVNAKGAPVVGHPVSVSADLGNGGEAATVTLRSATTGENGEATLRLSADREETDYWKFFVAFPFPTADQPRIPFDPWNPPEMPIEIVAPSTGSIVVTLDSAEPPTRAEAPIAVLRRARPADTRDPVWDESTWAPVAAFRDGVATFSHVEVGLELEAEVHTYDQSRRVVTHRFAGPTTAGERLEVTIPAGERWPTFIGRIVTPAGTPVSRAVVHTKFFGRGLRTPSDIPRLLGLNHNLLMSPRPSALTDGDGRFVVPIPHEPGPWNWEAVRFHVEWERRTHWIASRDLPDALAPGETQFGDLVFEGTRPLLAGRVLDPAGEPVAGAKVAVMRDVRGSPMRDRRVPWSKTDAEGRFELWGTTGADHVDIGVSADGLYLDAPVPQPKGEIEAVIELSTAGGIAGSVVVPERMQDAEVTAILRGEPTRNNDTEGREEADAIETDVGASGRFSFDNLRPGTARLEIQVGHAGSRGTIHVGDLTIAEGVVNRDPRIQRIDVGAGLREFRVTAVDRDAKPVPKIGVTHRAAGTDGDWVPAFRGEEGVFVHSREPAVDVLVMAMGYRSALRKGVAADLQVVLEGVPVVEVRVRLPEGAELPRAPWGLEPILRWDESPADEFLSHRDPVVWSEGIKLLFGRSINAFDATRSVTFEAWDPGRYRVELWLWDVSGSESRRHSVGSVPERPIITLRGDGKPVTIEVAMDEDDYRRILEREE